MPYGLDVENGDVEVSVISVCLPVFFEIVSLGDDGRPSHLERDGMAGDEAVDDAVEEAASESDELLEYLLRLLLANSERMGEPVTV